MSDPVNTFDIEALGVMPVHVTIDSSFAWCALVPSVVGHREALRFVDEIRRAGSALYFNRMVELELVENVVRARRGRRRFADGPTSFVTEVMSAWSALIAGLDAECVEVEDVADHAVELSTFHSISVSDALHAATASVVDSSGLATIRREVGAVPGTTLRLFSTGPHLRALRRRRVAANSRIRAEVSPRVTG